MQKNQATESRDQSYQAIELHNRGKQHQASALLKPYSQKNIKDPEKKWVFANQLLKSSPQGNQLKEDENSLLIAIRRDQNNWQYLFKLGLHYCSLGRFKKSLRFLNLAKKLNSNEKQITNKFEEIQKHIKMEKQALLKKLQEDNSIQNLNKCAFFHLLLEQWPQASRYYQQALSKKSEEEINISILHEYGPCAYQLDNTQSMEKTFEKAINKFPDKLDLYTTLLIIYNRKRKFWKSYELSKTARMLLQKNIQIEKNQRLRFFREYMNLLIKVNKMVNKTKEIKNIHKEYEKCGGERIEIAGIQGVYHLLQRQMEFARSFFMDALKDDPFNPQALCNYAILLQQFGSDTQAFQQYKQALKQYPGDLTINLNYAGLLMKKKSHITAIKYYQFCLMLGEQDIVYNNYAQLQYKIGYIDSAISNFKRALETQKQPNILVLNSILAFSFKVKNKDLLNQCLSKLRKYYNQLEELETQLTHFVGSKQKKQIIKNNLTSFFQCLQNDLTANAIFDKPQYYDQIQSNLNKICEDDSKILICQQKYTQLLMELKKEKQLNVEQQKKIQKFQKDILELQEMNCKLSQEILNIIHKQFDMISNKLLTDDKENRKIIQQVIKTQQKMIGNKQHYQNLLNNLKSDHKTKSVLYAQTLTSMLIHTINAYTYLHYNLFPQKNVIQTKVGETLNFLNSLSQGLKNLKQSPIAQMAQGSMEFLKDICSNYCQLFVGVAGVIGVISGSGVMAIIASILAGAAFLNKKWAQYDANQVIKKIHNVFLKFQFHQDELSQEVREAVLCLMKDNDHLKILQTKDKQPWHRYPQMIKAAKQMVNSLAKIEKMEDDEQKAATDCTMMLLYTLTCQDSEPKPLQMAAQYVLKEKKKNRLP